MKKTIVIAEDNDMLSKVLEYRLKSDGYEVAIFNDGEGAIAFMRKNQFDMVITDLYMPMMNGMEVIQIIRESISTDVPILAVSAAHGEDMITSVFDAGATDFIVKPFRVAELSIRVKRLLSISRMVR